MPSGFQIATAWVSVKPNLTGFAASLKAQASSAASAAGNQSSGSFANSFVSGTTFGKTGAIATGIASGLAVIPGLAAAAGAAAGIALGAKLLIGTKRMQGPLYQSFTDMTKSIKDVMQKAAAPLIQPLKDAFSSLSGFFRQMQPVFHDFFAALGPLVAPFVHGIEGLVSGVMPGFIALMKAALPAVQSLSSFLRTLGHDLGGFLSALAPAVKDSAQFIQPLASALGSLLPIIGHLAASFSASLVPVISSLLAAFKSVEPAITAVGKVLGSLAGAVLGSISGTLSLLGRLIQGVAPAINTLAGAFGQVFKVLENSGVLFVLENALAQIVPPLTQVISELVKGLAPVLPQVISLFGQLVALLAGQLGNVLMVLLNALIPLIPPLTEIVRWVVELINTALKPLLPVIAAVILGWKALTVALTVNPWGAIITAVVLMVTLVVKYHTQIWDFIKTIWTDIKNFIEGLWNSILDFAKQWWPLLLGPSGLIVKYHNDIFSFIKQIWNSIFGFFKNIWNQIYSFFQTIMNSVVTWFKNGWNTIFSNIQTVWNNILGFFRTIWNNLSSGFQTVVGAIGRAWNGLQSIFKAPVNFLINTVYDGGIARLWNDVMGAVGGPKLPIIQGLSSGGRIAGFGGGDVVPALLEPGEAVIDKHRTAALAPLFKAMGVPGFSLGGVIGDIGGFFGSLFGKGYDIAKIITALSTGNAVAATNAFDALIGFKTPAIGDLAKMMISIPKTMITDAIKAVIHLVTGLFTGGGAPGPGGGQPAANAALARSLYASVLTPAMWDAWNYVAMRESGWNQFARNPSSGAYGIPQALPPSKMGPAANPPQSNPTAQIRWMWSYMQQAYGGPIGAAAHERAFNWYGYGGVIPEPVIGIGLSSGRGYGFAENGPETVTPGRGSGGVVNFNFYGTQYPNNEQIANLMQEASLRLAVAP